MNCKSCIKQSKEIQKNRYKAKPIFKEEKEFIEEHLPEIAPLPDDCWIVGGSTKSIFDNISFQTAIVSSLSLPPE